MSGGAPYDVERLIAEARRLAAEYRRATGRPLAGVSGEIAEHDAARLLDLELCSERPGGWDAIGRGRRAGKRIQIKARAIFDERKSGQRIGQLKLDKEWDSVVLVLFDENFEPFEIWEAERPDVEEAVAASRGARARRGALSVARFKRIGRLVWTREEGEIEDEIWEHPGR
ncbi:MAG TPA: hypothetical protein ENK20_05675 [Chromatiales bacterium]|nr:hypothetical protein [Chromatiales bacterium]